MTRASDYAWFNGTITARESGAPSVASNSFHLGTSVFDGMMAYWNYDHYYIHMMEEHLSRFKSGATKLGLNFLWSVDDLIRGIQTLLDQEPKGDQYIRPIAYRRVPELWITGNEGRPVDVSIFTVRATRNIDETVACHFSPVQRVSSRAFPQQIKVSGSYVNSFHCRRTAELNGYHDGIMLTDQGYIAEASAANVFFIRDDQVITPNLGTDTFPGLTRTTVMMLAQSKGIYVAEKNIKIDDLDAVDGAFLCSTLMEIRPIGRLEARRLATVEVPLFQAILAEFRKITSQ